MTEEKPKRLGRGLAALIGENNAALKGDGAGESGKRVPIEFIRANPRNPRKSFEMSDLEELSQSIKEKGILQPIVVRPIPDLQNVYEIIAGERRWRAAQRADLHEVPVIVIQATDQEALELALVENIQRADLNVIEEAIGYDQLMREFGHTQLELSKIIGKSRSHIANNLRLLKLPHFVRDRVTDGLLTAGHARALLAVEDPDFVAGQIISNNLSVRDVERIAQEEAERVKSTSPSAPKVKKQSHFQEKDADTLALENILQSLLGMPVVIQHRGDAGEMRIQYSNLEQLDALCQRLRG
jgi:ParB family transcriptional regulator, chromosome partitioning protein